MKLPRGSAKIPAGVHEVRKMKSKLAFKKHFTHMVWIQNTKRVPDVNTGDLATRQERVLPTVSFHYKPPVNNSTGEF